MNYERKPAIPINVNHTTVITPPLSGVDLDVVRYKHNSFQMIRGRKYPDNGNRAKGQLTGAKLEPFKRMWTALVKHYGSTSATIEQTDIGRGVYYMLKDEKPYLSSTQGEAILKAYRQLQRVKSGV